MQPSKAMKRRGEPQVSGLMLVPLAREKWVRVHPAPSQAVSDTVQRGTGLLLLAMEKTVPAVPFIGALAWESGAREALKKRRSEQHGSANLLKYRKQLSLCRMFQRIPSRPRACRLLLKSRILQAFSPSGRETVCEEH